MFQRSNSFRNHSGRPHFNRGSRFNNGQRGGSRPRRGLPPALNPALFVNKAVEQVVVQHPITHKFSDFLIVDRLKQNILQKGYDTPTPIQDQAIPVVLEGKDVVGIANTGTGKTGAFLIPLINKVFNDRTQRVLIIAPTRELALQIQDEFVLFTRGMGIYSALIIGGTNMYRQIQDIRRNPQFVIGTPGRIKDLWQQKQLNLSTFNNTVLDEVDRMLDMGFINDIRFLIEKLPEKRQSLFFSATMPPQIEGIMHTFLKEPVKVSVKTHNTAAAIEQNVVKVNGRNKIEVLEEVLSQQDVQKAIIFGRTKFGIEKLSKVLYKNGFKVASIHGNKTQGQRQRAIEQFKRGSINILLATDIASRGLDIDDVTHVINYDQPASYEDYVHRIGRTGRANKKGVALTFVD